MSQNGARLCLDRRTYRLVFLCLSRYSLTALGIRIESKHEVTILGGLNEFIVKFFGPSGSKSEHIFMF